MLIQSVLLLVTVKNKFAKLSNIL